MFVAQAHSFTQQARLAITLAWVAGYTNILTVLTCGTVTSHVTGTVSQWGLDLVQGRWGLMLFTSFLLATFLAGAMISAVCTETGRRRGWESIYVLPIAVQASLLAAFAFTVERLEPGAAVGGARLYFMTGLASAAMGLQNATITRLSGGVVRTTHMTGVFTDLGLESVQFAYWVRDRHSNSPPLPASSLIRSVQTHPTARRLALLASVVGSFALGAGLGALAFGEFPRWAMFAPVLFLFWIIYQDVRLPICEIEPSELVATGGLGLPGSIAVYHLRKDRTRRGRIHRMPNLLAWSDRLPESIRVVILDLHESTRVDANAALELRALIDRFRLTGRNLIIAGIDPARFEELRRAGADGSLNPTNMCSDLELAIARGLSMLDDSPRG